MIYSWKKIVMGGLPLLTLCVLIEIFAGSILQSGEEVLVVFPIFLMSIPVINGVGGNVGSILGARIASGLHVGSIELDIRDKRMQENLFNVVTLGIVIYALLAIIIYLMTSLMGIQANVGAIDFVAAILCTGVLLIFMVSLVSVVTAFLAFKYGRDPDDMVAPVVTTVGDTLGILLLFLMMGVIGLI